MYSGSSSWATVAPGQVPTRTPSACRAPVMPLKPEKPAVRTPTGMPPAMSMIETLPSGSVAWVGSVTPLPSPSMQRGSPSLATSTCVPW